MTDSQQTYLSVQGNLSTSTLLAFQEADKMGIKYREVPNTLLVEMEYKGIKRYYKPQIPFQTSHTGFYIASHKHIGKQFLTKGGISIPKGISLTKETTQQEHLKAFADLKKPLVVKPTNGTQGQKVFMGILTEQDYLNAIVSEEEDFIIIVEEEFPGKEYRILATQEKVLGIVLRIPANVIGDGVHTISELIEIKNSDPRRFDNREAALVKIKIDEHVTEYMSQNKISFTDIPTKGERVFLRSNSNISTGGDSIDCTDLAHPSVKEIALRAMRSVPGLSIGGIDFVTKDIASPQTPDSYVILEINASPGYSLHDLPYEGISRNVAREFIYILFPEARKDFETL
jgi:D-alanine-D-alanine ligase-like ATP-grasp enzyme